MKRAGSAFSALAVLAALVVVVARANVPGLEDPTRPLVLRDAAPETSPEASPEASPRPDVPRLTSVLIGKGRKLAMIDGQLMSEGETRAGLKVWKIAADHAVVSVGGGNPVTLSLDNPRMHKENR